MRLDAWAVAWPADPPGRSLFPNTRRRAPQAPSRTPPAFLPVIGSLMNIAAKIMVTIGSVVVMIEASTGEVIETPVTYTHWLRIIAKSPAKKNLI